MKTNVTYFLTLILAGLFLFSCSKDDMSDLAGTDSTTAEDVSRCDETIVVDFLAGQTTDVGDVIITQEGDSIVSITIDMHSGFELEAYHIYMGPTSEIPLAKNNSNPKVGRFPYKHVWNGNTSVTQFELRIPISVESDKPVAIAVHGKVSGAGNQSAWADGVPISASSTNWSTKINFILDACAPPVDLCSGFMTLTQDQWGDPNSTGGMILTDEFVALAGLDNIISVGCIDSIEWDNGADVIAYLPDNSGIVSMNASYFNTTSGVSTTAGELVALRLNLAADANIPAFSSAGSALGDQQYIEFNNYFGLNVNQVLLDGQKVLTGCLAQNIVELTGAVESINGAYANGNDGAGILFCPFQ